MATPTFENDYDTENLSHENTYKFESSTWQPGRLNKILFEKGRRYGDRNRLFRRRRAYRVRLKALVSCIFSDHSNLEPSFRSLLPCFSRSLGHSVTLGSLFYLWSSPSAYLDEMGRAFSSYASTKVIVLRLWIEFIPEDSFYRSYISFRMDKGGDECNGFILLFLLHMILEYSNDV